MHNHLRPTVLLTAIVAAIVFLPAKAQALSCIPPPPFAEAVTKAEVIIEALPQDLLDTEHSAFVWDTRITKVYKGNLRAAENIVVRHQVWPSTDNAESTMHENEPMLLFLRWDSESEAYNYQLCDYMSRSLKTRPLTTDEKNTLAGTSSNFPDVPPTHPNFDAISYVRAHGIVEGYPNGMYDPSSTINRAEFTKIITLALYDPDMIEKCGSHYFLDVPRESWFWQYACRARDGWLLTGYPDGTFRPTAAINFVEAAKILANAYGLSEEQKTISIERTDCSGKLCRDTDTVGHPWFENYVRALAAKEAIPLSISAFDHHVTRGEMAEMIYRIKANITTKPSRTYATLRVNGDNEQRSVWPNQ